MMPRTAPRTRTFAKGLRAARRAARRLGPQRVGAWALCAALLAQLVVTALPPPWMQPAAAAEFVSSPQYLDVELLPDGQVGMIFRNDAGGGVVETRFKRYAAEYAMDASLQLSTASPAHPQLAVFQGKVVAAYVDTRAPNAGKLVFRTSADSGASWSAESYPLGSVTFDSGNAAPRVVASRDAQTLYVFSANGSNVPQYRLTTDPTLVTWSALGNAGDSSMKVPSNNNCGASGQECYRAHQFGFMETATAGLWIYITKSPSGFGQSGRGTQVGTLGGSWSAQVDHGGSGGGTGCCGESTATTFLDRSGNIYYVRAGSFGGYLYYKKSSDGGYTWGPIVQAYWNTLDRYTTASPVGLFVPGHSRGEYVWYAGFGGVGIGNDQNAVRVVPLWTQTQHYMDTGTARLFGTLGGDWDLGTAYPYTFGRRDIPTGVGAYKTGATDLRVPGRLLNFSFSRSYSSADLEPGPLGPAWTHGLAWAVRDNAAIVEVRRGDGRRDLYTRNPDLTYTAPPNVFDVLIRNGDATFTLTQKNQTTYDFSSAGKLTRILEPAGNQIMLGYINGRLAAVTDSVGRVVNVEYNVGHNLALGKTYTKSVVAHASYPDTGGVELTDGTVGNATNFHDASWQGHTGLSSPLDVTIDLGSSQSIGLVRSYYYESVSDGIVKPASVEIQTSPDNVTYTSRGSTPAGSAFDDTGNLWRYDLTLSAISARYLRFRITKGGNWIFSSEMQVWRPGSNPIEAQAGTNTAQAKTYTKSVAAHATYPDTAGTELTDGNLGDPLNRAHASWQGHQNLGATPLEVTVDLTAAQRLGVVRSYHYHDPGTQTFRPATIELLSSTDNVQYTSRGATVRAAAVNDTGNRWRYEFDLAGISARWVRFRITAAGQWLFSSEVQVFAEGSGPITLPLSYGDRVIKVADPTGRFVSYGYDQNGRLTRVVDLLGNAQGQDPTLHTWHYTYDAQTQHIATLVDPDGRVRVTNTYQSEGRLATQQDGAGNQTSFGYGTQQTTITDPRGHVSTQTFDTRWRPTSQVDLVGQNTYALEFGYDASGNLVYAIDRNQKRTDFSYDTRGNVLTRTQPEIDPQTPRYVTTYTYDPRNNPLTLTDPKGFLTTHTYDATQNVRLATTSQIDATAVATTKWEYTDAANPGLPTRVIAPRGNTGGSPDYAYSTTFTYDSSGNLTQTIDADGAKTTHGYDTLGRRTTTVDPEGYAPGEVPADHTWSTAYDPLDRVTSETNPLGHGIFYGYDGAGNVLTSTDRNGNVTSYAYDAAGRLATVMQKPDPTGQPNLVYTTTIGRDANGNAAAVTQANAVITDYAFDPLDRLTSMTSHPAGGTNLVTSYALDGNGNTLTRTTADGVVTTYSYDALSRLTQVAATGLSTVSYAYDELSRRTSMTDGTGTTTYSYDRMGRLTQAAQPNGTVAYAYDLDSNRTTLTYPGPSAVAYTYSNGGRLSSLVDWGSRTTSYTYSAAGLAKTATLPNGLITSYTYDRAQRLTNLTNVVGSTTITSHAYTLDNEGNRTAQTEFVSGITSGASDSFGYTYDGLNRLTAVTTTNAEGFTLDSASNIASRTGPAATFSYDTSNRLTGDGSQTYTWSAADRLTGRGSDTFGYDPLDRLTSSSVSGTSRTYAYNGDGLLQSRTLGSTTNFLWDPATSPSRLLQVGSDKIVYGLGPLYAVAGSTTTTFARDSGKSVRAEVDSSGAVTGAWRYRAYGEINQSNGAAAPSYLGYAGQLLDPSGLYYLRARWYDAAPGRFLSRDPISTGPSSLNSYGYAAANPILFGDPSGLMVAIPDGMAGPICTCTKPVPDDVKTGILTTPVSEPIGLLIADPVREPCAAPCRWIIDPVSPVAGTRIWIFVPPPPFNGLYRDDDAAPVCSTCGAGPSVDYPGEDTQSPPGEGWTPTRQIDWSSPDGQETLHPHLDSDHGAHWDWKYGRKEHWWYPDGRLIHKGWP